MDKIQVGYVSLVSNLFPPLWFSAIEQRYQMQELCCCCSVTKWCPTL